MKTTRPATHDDVPRLVELGRAFFASSPFAGLGQFADEDAAGTFASLIDGECSTILVAEDDGVVVGMVGLVYVPMWFAPSITMAQELFWFVDAEARQGGAGKALLNHSTEWARQHGVNMLSMSHFAGNNNFDVGAIYRRHGFDLYETAYVKKTR